MSATKKSFLGATHERGHQKPENICELFMAGKYNELSQRISGFKQKIPLIEQGIRAKHKQPAAQQQKISNLRAVYASAQKLVAELVSNPSNCNKNQAKQLFVELQSVME